MVRFRECCQRALESALALVSFCSGIKASLLEQWYRKLCKQEDRDNILRADFPDAELDEDELDEQAMPDAAEDRTFADVISQAWWRVVRDFFHEDQYTSVVGVNHDLVVNVFAPLFQHPLQNYDNSDSRFDWK